MKNKFKARIFQSLVALTLLLISSIALADIPINIFKSTYQSAKALNNKKIESIINDNLELSKDLHHKVNVKVIYDVSGYPDYLIVYTLSKDSYSFKTSRIDIDAKYKVTSVKKNYKETEADSSQGKVDVYATCPDESIEMVFSTCETGIASAVAGVNAASQTATNAGYRTKVLLGSAENTTAILNWLSCDNLVYFGRIGHGSSSGIMVSNGTLSYNDFQNMSSNTLNNKVLYFNSCQVHNNPLLSSILNAGVQKYIGGITNLGIGPSEEVFKCVAEKSIRQHQALTPTLSYCESQYPSAGTHGISGSGSDYVADSSGGGTGGDLTANDVLGQYVRQPPANSWHTGTISMVGNSLQWQNQAGVKWLLIPDFENEKLLTNQECPYNGSNGGDAFTLVVQQNNDGSVEVEGFRFLGELYTR